MFRRLSLVIAGTLAASAIAMSVFAADVYVQPGDWSGSRTTLLANQLLGTGNWSGSGLGARVAWVISLSGDIYTYEYTFSNGYGGPLHHDLSHVILSVSSSFTADDIWNVTGAGLESDSPKVQEIFQGNPNMPQSVYALRFECPDSTTGPIILSFQTRRAPVWGDVYLKGGLNDSAWNTGFGLQPLANYEGWIARPDTVDVIPEPVYFQMGTLISLSGLALLRIRRRTP